MCTLIAFYLLLKYRSCCTWEHFLSYAFTYLKLAATFLFYLISIRFFCYYVIFELFILILEKLPVYSGHESMITKVESRQHFDCLIQGASANKTRDFSKLKHYFVLFTSANSENCYFTYPMWSRMARRYTTEGLQFLEVDVHSFEGLCSELKINHRLVQQSLPTVIMFEDGREVLRFPFAPEDKNTASKQVHYKEKELIKLFDLEKRHLATIGPQQKKKAAT